MILHELGLEALARGDRRRAINLAAEAQSLVPDLAAPAVYHARLLLQDGRTGQAAKAVERAWRTAPHPELAQAYGAISNGAAPLARIKSFERLAAQNPTARESHLTLAEAALEAHLWGEARRHLEQALNAASPPPMSKSPRLLPPATTPAANEIDHGLVGPTPRLCLMMARLEEAEHGSEGAMREWLDRAVTAMPDARYVCATCGGRVSNGARCARIAAISTGWLGGALHGSLPAAHWR